MELHSLSHFRQRIVDEKQSINVLFNEIQLSQNVHRQWMQRLWFSHQMVVLESYNRHTWHTNTRRTSLIAALLLSMKNTARSIALCIIPTFRLFLVI